MSFMEMPSPASARAPDTAAAPRSTTSLSGYLPNLVMWIPRIQTSSLIGRSARRCLAGGVRRGLSSVRAGSKPKPMASTPWSSAPSEYVASRTGMPVETWSGSGSTLIRFPRTGVPSQSMTADTNGVGMPGAAWATIVKVVTVPSGDDLDLVELGAEASRAGVAAVEVAGAAAGAFLGHEVGLIAQHQVVHEGDLFAHRPERYDARAAPHASNHAHGDGECRILTVRVGGGGLRPVRRYGEYPTLPYDPRP